MVCRVFKKMCFFKAGSEGRASQGSENYMNPTASHDLQPRPPSSQCIHPYPVSNLYYSQLPLQSYSHGQVQDLLRNHRPTGYDFSVLPGGEESAMVKPYRGELEQAEGMQHVGEVIREQSLNDWSTVLDGIDRRFGSAGGPAVQQMIQITGQRGGEIDLWGYGK